MEDQKLILDNEGTVRDEETFEEYKEAVVANTPSLFSVYDPSENMVMIDVSTAMRFYDVVSSNHFPSFFALDQYFSETLVKKYACSVQAAAINGILIYGLDPNGYANDYNAIWNCTGTTTYGVENGISYGTTEDGNLGRGFANFLMNYKGYSNITYSENVNPQLAFFKGAIDTSRVAAFSYRVNGANSGHTVAVEGYMDARVKGTGASVPFLMVADGWQEEVRYINLNYSSFARRRGIIWSGVKVSY